MDGMDGETRSGAQSTLGDMAYGEEVYSATEVDALLAPVRDGLETVKDEVSGVSGALAGRTADTITIGDIARAVGWPGNG